MAMHLLVADDDAIAREAVAAQLRALGHEVALAEHAEMACTLATQARFDAVLIDLRLDGEDGRALLHRLRRLSGTRFCRAIAISAELDPRLASELRAEGFDAALQKPISLQQLRIALAELGTTGTLDDAAALAIWGNIDTVRMLRAMLRDELPIYRDLLRAAVQARDETALREVLHRMKSSANFCGAIPLQAFLDATKRDPIDWDDLLDRYDAACALLIPSLASSAT